MMSPFGRRDAPVTHVNLARLAELMPKIANFLESVVDMLEMELQTQVEHMRGSY